MIETTIIQREQLKMTNSSESRQPSPLPSAIPAKVGGRKRLRSFDKNRHIQKTKKLHSRLRENDKKNVSRIPLKRRPHLAAAFTMVELLVALMVLILLLGITAVIYKSSSDAMTQTNASVAMYQDVNALTRQIDQVMKGIYTDGYLVIYGYDVRDDTDHVAEKTPDGKILFDDNQLESVRSDAICFFTTGSFNSLTDQSIAANSGWVYIGHADPVIPDTFGSSPFSTNSASNPLTSNQWVLSRYMLLFTPGSTSAGTYPDFDYRKEFEYPAGGPTYKCTVGSYMRFWMEPQFAAWMTADTDPDKKNAKESIRNWLYRVWVNDYSTSAPYFGTPPQIDFNNDVVFPYTLGNCGSFKIEFAMPASYSSVNSSSSVPETQFNQIVWRDVLLNPNPAGLTALANSGTINAANHRANDHMVVFGPRDVWPLMIRFTLRKYDENLSITSEERFDTGNTHTHGGQTFEYVYKLPQKN